jgi:hypothetical protein
LIEPSVSDAVIPPAQEFISVGILNVPSAVKLPATFREWIRKGHNAKSIATRVNARQQRCLVTFLAVPPYRMAEKEAAGQP